MTDNTEPVFRYEPDYAVPPGETLAEVLETREMSQAELARRTGLSAKHINLILKGSATITPDTALKLEHVLNIPARIWNALEANYQGHLSRLGEARDLEEHIGWASPELIKDLASRGCIRRVSDRIEQIREVLKFFGVASISAWSTVWNESSSLNSYRLAKQQGDPVALAAWMRIGELSAAEIETGPFDREVFREVLLKARALTRTTDPHDWLPQLQEICRRVGVVVIIEKELPKARVNGVARWLSPYKALIQLSARYLRDDVLWFTFFHEAGHLLLHGRKSGPRDVPATFIDTKDSAGHAEDEANTFAADLLIPPRYAERLPHIKSLDEVRQLANDLRISPGIIVGRLHHEKLKQPSWGAGLIVRYRW
ncbi:MAG: helix-turn-helix domain-containing protein [Streptosporangiaceae bacterium]|nr:helix-turn-helix domain-containing protein [Streptosporangiaceae bacterium]